MLLRWINLTFPTEWAMWSFRRWRTCCCCFVRSEESGGWRATKIGLQHAGLKINLRIYNAVFFFIESFPFNSPDQLERSIRSQQLCTTTHAHPRQGHSLRLESMEAARLNVLFYLLWSEAWSASRPHLVPGIW